MQNGPKWSLVHKFVERSRVGIFRNERTRSTPLDSKQMFSGILNCFVTAGTSAKNGPNWSFMYKFVERSRVGIFRNERTRSTPLDPKLGFWGVSSLLFTARTSVQNRPNKCH
jgi:hypothetical protein